MPRCFWFAAIFVFTGAAQGQKDGDLRLVDSLGTTGGSGGRVEIYYSGQWGTICDDGFGQTEADTVCRQLGFNSSSNSGNRLDFDSGSSLQVIWLDDVQCTSNGTDLLRDCSYRTPIGSENCFHSEDIKVECSNDARSNRSGDLRLVQRGITSSSFDEGRLEIFINGQWGTICDDRFGQTEANVACRQLGYSVASEYGNDLGFGSGSSLQPIWLDDVDCRSSDMRIIDCSYAGFGVGNCRHSKDIMINCGTVVNVAGIGLGSFVGLCVLLLICIGVVYIYCAHCRKCASSAFTRSRHTGAADTTDTSGLITTATTLPPIEFGAPAQQPPPVTATIPAQQANTAAAQFGAPAQHEPPANISHPVQDYGNETKLYLEAELSSQPPPAYDAAQQYPPPTQAPSPTDQQAAAAVVAPAYPVAGDSAYPPGYPPQEK